MPSAGWTARRLLEQGRLFQESRSSFLHRMMMALLEAKRDGSLFAVALYRWKQPIENMFAVQAPKLWSPEPSTS
jgi:hypothetical protein